MQKRLKSRFLVFVLVTCVITTASRQTLSADRPVASFDFGSPESLLITTVGFFHLLALGRATGAWMEYGATKKTREQIKADLKQVRKEYLAHKRWYEQFPQQIMEMKAENDNLKVEVKKAERARDDDKVEELLSKIEANNASIRSKSSKVPWILLAEAVHSIMVAEETLTEHLKTLPSKVNATRPALHTRVVHKAMGAINGNGRNGNGKAEVNGDTKTVPVNRISEVPAEPVTDSTAEATVSARDAVRFWEERGRLDRLKTWIDSDEAQEFFKVDTTGWYNTYRTLMNQLEDNVDGVVEQYNKTVDHYNGKLGAANMEKKLPRLEKLETFKVLNPRRFSLEPENESDQSEQIARNELTVRQHDVCDKNLARLKDRRSELEHDVKWVVAHKRQLVPTAWTVGLWGGTYGAYAIYKWKTGETFDDASKRNKLNEQTSMTLSGQWEDEKKKKDRLRPYINGGVDHLYESHANIAKQIESTFDFRDKNAPDEGGKTRKQLLDELTKELSNKKPEEIRARLASNWESSSWEFFHDRELSIEQIVAMLYTADEASREGMVRDYVNQIYKRALMKTFPNIINERIYDLIEPSVVPPLVEATLKDLTREVRKLRKEGVDSIPVAPVPGVTPTEAPKDSQAAKLSTDTTNHVVGVPALGQQSPASSP